MTTTQRPSPYRGWKTVHGRTLYEQIRIRAYKAGWPDDAAHDAANFMVKAVGNQRLTGADLKFTCAEALRTY